ncbi:MAG: glycosyltransferase family 2 protein [Burkholderiaceae bacterium]|nr:MAG: glycosyltransferase family 2 protein [Burkholderiaceae bacterium]
MKKTPTLSILIPTYNYGHYIEKAIHSVLKQDFQDFELIISNNCSEDDTQDRVARIADQDNRIKLYKQPYNLGMVGNWNWCLNAARGEFILFLFADDYLLTNHTLSSLISPLSSANGLSMCAAGRMIVSASEKPLHKARDLEEGGVIKGSTVIRRCLVENGNLIGEPSAVMFRRKYANRGFRSDYRQLVDLEMWFHLAEQGDLFFIDKPLVAFRNHEEQQTAINSKDTDARLEILKLIGEYWPPTELAHATRSDRMEYALMCYTIHRHLISEPELNSAAVTYRPLLERGMAEQNSLLLPLLFRIHRSTRTWKRSIRKRLKD